MQAASPHVTVLMAVHDEQSFVGRAIESILSQSLTDFEFLIIDDGSEDQTPQILAEYAETDHRIRVKRVSQQGLGACLAYGVSQSRGACIARMDGDDVAHPERLQRQMDWLARHPEVAAVGAAARFIDEDGDLIGHRSPPLGHDAITRQLFTGRGGAMIHPSVVIRREALNQAGGYDPAYARTEDLDLFLRLGEVGRLANLPDVLTDFRLTPRGRIGREVERQAMANRHQIVRAACQRRGLAYRPNMVRYARIPRSPAGHHVMLAETALLNRCPAAARKHLMRALCQKRAWAVSHLAFWLPYVGLRIAGSRIKRRIMPQSVKQNTRRSHGRSLQP